MDKALTGELSCLGTGLVDVNFYGFDVPVKQFHSCRDVASEFVGLLPDLK